MDLNSLMAGSGELAALVANLVRVGEVTSVDPSKPTARVVFADRDNVESYDLQIVAHNSLQNKGYWTPDVGENVLCLFLPAGVEAGFIIGAYYPEGVERPFNSIDKEGKKFADGTVIVYDRSSNTLDVNLSPTSGTVNINCGGGEVNVVCDTATVQAATQVLLDTPLGVCKGDFQVGGGLSVAKGSSFTGDANFSGGVTNKGVNISSTHTHGGVQSGGSSTGEPQ